MSAAWLTRAVPGLYALVVRFLLVNNHCISDPTAGVTQSLRTIIEWLADAGHACHILTTARFESPVTFTIEEHLRRAGRRRSRRLAAPAERRQDARVQIARRALHGRGRAGHAAADPPQRRIATRSRRDRAIPGAARQLLDDFAPDQLIACNGHPMIFETMARARRRAAITTAFAVRGFGYYERRYFADVDHAFTCSQFLSGVLSRKSRAVQHADRAADRLVVGGGADRIARLRDVRQPVAAQGTAAVCAARRHARVAPTRHSDPGRAVGPQRRIAERDSGH